MRSRHFLIMATAATGALFVPVERAALTLLGDGPVPLYAQALADKAGGGGGQRDHAGRDRSGRSGGRDAGRASRAEAGNNSDANDRRAERQLDRIEARERQDLRADRRQVGRVDRLSDLLDRDEAADPADGGPDADDRRAERLLDRIEGLSEREVRLDRRQVGLADRLSDLLDHDAAENDAPGDDVGDTNSPDADDRRIERVVDRIEGLSEREVRLDRQQASLADRLSDLFDRDAAEDDEGPDANDRAAEHQLDRIEGQERQDLRADRRQVGHIDRLSDLLDEDPGGDDGEDGDGADATVLGM